MKHVLLKLCLLLALAALLVLPAAAVTPDATVGPVLQDEQPVTEGFLFDLAIYGNQNFDMAKEVVDYVNSYRAAEGLAPVTLDSQLVDCAMQRGAELMVYYSHTRPDGTRCNTVMSGTPFGGGGWGENIAIGYSSVSSVCSAWYNSQGHRDNMLNPNYKSIGVGCFYQNGSVGWVQLFSTKPAGSYEYRSGTNYVSWAPITMNTDYLQLYVSPQECNVVQMYQGVEQKMTVELGNMGYSSWTKTKLADCYSFVTGDENILGVNGTKLVGNNVGTTSVWLDISNLRATLTGEVVARPTLKLQLNDQDYPYLTWTDPLGDASLFWKAEGDDIWTYGYTGENSFIHYAAQEGTRYTYVLRMYDDDGEAVDLCEPLEYFYGKPATPKVKAENVASTGKIKLSWAKVSGAEKYEIYRKTGSNGKYVKLRSQTGTTYTNASITPGVTYYYRVRAVGEDGRRSEFSATVSKTCDLARPVVTATNIASSGKVKLTWKAVEGATGYEVYRATSKNGTYKKLSTVKGTSYTNTSATPAKTYYYKVRAVCGKAAAASAYSAVDSITVDLARPVVTASNIASNGKVKLTWKAVEGATGYEVYRATSKNGTYKKLNTVKGTSYTNTSATPAKTYYYKVRAVCSKAAAASAYSAVDAITVDLARPEVTVRLKNGKPYLKWDEVDGAVKYELYRKAGKNGTYVKLNTTAATSYHNPSAKSGVTYYYRVRAVCKVSGATSAWCTVSVRVP